MSESKPQPQSQPRHRNSDKRWTLMRDVLVFQLKLIMDGLRDIAMSPISLGAAIAGIFMDREEPGRLFYQSLRFGRRTERWINLFGAASRLKGVQQVDGVDGYFQIVEQKLKEGYEKGGVTKNARDAIDKALDRAQDAVYHRIDKNRAEAEDPDESSAVLDPDGSHTGKSS